MSNRVDYDELVAGERDEDVVVESGGGAALAVFLTLLVGCALVFAAYKLGQRTGVDDPPVLMAEQGEIREVPEDPGGRAIPNTENEAYAMIDERREGAGDATGGGLRNYARRDGLIVKDALPVRDLSLETELEVGELRRDSIAIDKLRPIIAAAGEPALTTEGAPDRTEERVALNGTELFGADGGALAAVDGRGAGVSSEAAAASGQGAGVEGGGTDGTLETATETRVESPELRVTTLSYPAPRVKPALIVQQRLAARAPTAQQRTASVSASASGGASPASTRSGGVAQPVPQPTQIAPPQPVGGLVAATTPSGQVIPPQPAGDAQIQLGALPSERDVRIRWGTLKAQHADLLGQLGLQVRPVTTSNGQALYRLRAGPLSDGRTAARLCDQLRFRGVECFVPARQR